SRTNTNNVSVHRYRLKFELGFGVLENFRGRFQPSCGERRRSIEGEGRRRRGHSKKREKKENQEDLDVKPFLDPDLAPPSLEDPDPEGNNKAAARIAEETVSFITSYVTLRLLLRRRPETFAAFDVLPAFLTECCR
ncbi:hypothetical protein BHM03_00054137, partial [Ensete ventricosum]